MTTNASSTNGQAISASIGGTDITVYNNIGGSGNRTLVKLNGANTFTGSLIISGDPTTATAFSKSSQVAINHPNALGGPTNTNDVKFARNFSQMVFTAGGAVDAPAYTASFANDIDLNSTGSTGVNGFTSGLGSATPGTVITLNGVIKGTGDANLVFTNGLSGGQGEIILANHETYSGNTSMTMASTATSTGIVALGINDALPTGTAFTLGNASGAPSGTFDLAGFNQKVASIATAGAGYKGGITNTGASLSTLTISGSDTTTFGTTTGANTISGNIGQTIITGKAELANSNDNIALELDSANVGQLTLARPAGNTYNGGTTVDGGTLLVANTSGSATGSGDVAVGSGGTLGGTGSIAGNVISSGTVSPGASIGALTLGANLEMDAGSYKYEINSDTPAADLTNVGGDLIIASGNVALNASDLGSTLLAFGTKFTLINYGGTWNGGTFTGLADDSRFHIGGHLFQINYNDTTAGLNGGSVGTGSSFVTISSVPEASAFLTVGLGGIFAIAAVWMTKRLGINVLEA